MFLPGARIGAADGGQREREGGDGSDDKLATHCDGPSAITVG
jgi:hypothetical protein